MSGSPYAPFAPRAAVDTTGPVEIAPRIWWVGAALEDDDFQCHAYLIEAGDDSVLLDPGGRLTWPTVREKVERVVPLQDVRWYVCHHPDPDITGALLELDRAALHPDARLVTHGRAAALLKHLDLPLPVWRVEGHGWRLQVGRRVLRFVFTPYAHSPGAFVTFDEASGVLFSSDLFGGFTDAFALYAKDQSYLSSAIPFHQRYMPSREILSHAMNAIGQLPYTLVAPQHGSILRKGIADFVRAQLSQLDCGLYLLAHQDTDVVRRAGLNDALRDLSNAMLLSREFHSVAVTLLEVTQRFLPVVGLAFWVHIDDEPDGRLLFLERRNRYRGQLVRPAPAVSLMLEPVDNARSSGVWDASDESRLRLVPAGKEPDPDHPTLLVRLGSGAANATRAVAALELKHDVPIDAQLLDIAAQIGPPLHIAVEREAIYRLLDLERERIYQRSIRDPLTGLFTRQHMRDTVERWATLQDRDASLHVAMVMLDIDHFKRVNDTFGHPVGDEVLRRISRVLQGGLRRGDLAVRMGGEEMALFLVGTNAIDEARVAERLRASIEALDCADVLDGGGVTVSAGAARRRSGEGLDALIERADRALYAAKRGGRNRVVVAEPHAVPHAEPREEPQAKPQAEEHP